VYGQVPPEEFQAYKDEAAQFVRNALRAEPKALELLAEAEFGVNPLEGMRKVIGGANWTLVPRTSIQEWIDFVAAKEELRNEIRAGQTSTFVLDSKRASVTEALKKWQDQAKEDIQLLMNKVSELEKREEAIVSIRAYEAALLKAKELIEEKREAQVDAAKKLAYERELGKLLNRTNHFLNLFNVALKDLGARGNMASNFWDNLTDGGFDNGNVQESTDRALADAKLLRHVIHFSAMCDLHAKHVLLEDPRLDAPLRAAAPAPAPAPAPAARTGASAAAAAAPKPSAKSRGKSPVRPRPGAVVPTSAAPPAPQAPAASPAPAVPAAAAGMSSTPLVPTQAGAAGDAAPRRRAREAAAGGSSESVTDSLFENMFKPTATAAAAEEPASPTPSSGSEGPGSGGPRTFRRQR
jgi:hypothetical protein